MNLEKEAAKKRETKREGEGEQNLFISYFMLVF